MRKLVITSLSQIQTDDGTFELDPGDELAVPDSDILPEVVADMLGSFLDEKEYFEKVADSGALHYLDEAEHLILSEALSNVERLINKAAELYEEESGELYTSTEAATPMEEDNG
jgi:intein/homing endonuclease